MNNARIFALAGILLAAVGVAAYSYHRLSMPSPPMYETTAPAQETAEPPGDGIFLQIPMFKQWDPEWGYDRIESSGEELRAVGCTLCCVSMVFRYYGVDVDPKRLNDFMNGNGGYTEAGWLNWDKAMEFASGAVKIDYIGDVNMKLIDENLERGNPVIVKVIVNGNIPHWVVVSGRDDEQYWVNDPLGEETGPIPLSVFGSRIHALRIFSKK